MIDIINAKIQHALTQHINILDTVDMSVLTTYINQFVYPIGIIPFNTFESQNYNLFPVQEKINYLKSNFAAIFSDYYTEEEIDIFVYYACSRAIGDFSIGHELLTAYTNIIQKSSEKKEVQYCIDEIKYRLLVYYVTYTNRTELILQLTDELTAIEAEHNTFFFNLRKAE